VYKQPPSSEHRQACCPAAEQLLALSRRGTVSCKSAVPVLQGMHMSCHCVHTPPVVAAGQQHKPAAANTRRLWQPDQLQTLMPLAVRSAGGLGCWHLSIDEAGLPDSSTQPVPVLASWVHTPATHTHTHTHSTQHIVNAPRTLHYICTMLSTN
jgi:hypothetical protein